MDITTFIDLNNVELLFSIRKYYNPLSHDKKIKALDSILNNTYSAKQLESEHNLINHICKYLFLENNNDLEEDIKQNVEILIASSRPEKEIKDSSIPLIPFTDLDEFNEEQMEVIEKLNHSKSKCLLLQSPPGTGKTTIIIELIKNLLEKGMKVLVASNSNFNLDNIALSFFTKLDEKGLQEEVIKTYKPVRLGSTKKTDPDLLPITINYLIKQKSDIPFELREKIVEYSMAIKNLNNRVEGKYFHNSNYLQLLENQIESLKRTFDGLKNQHIKNSKLVFSTLLSCDYFKNLIRNKKPSDIFDVLIIDDANRCSIPETLIPFKYCKSVILVGDQHQLKPIDKSYLFKNAQVKYERAIRSQEGNQNILNSQLQNQLNILAEFASSDYPSNQSLFSLILGTSFSKSNSLMLKMQYRMNKLIMDYCNKFFYSNQLSSNRKVLDQLLIELVERDKIKDEKLLTAQLAYINTCNMNVHHRKDPYSKSICNFGEAYITFLLVSKFISEGVKSENILILTPYNNQKNQIISVFNYLRNPDYENIEISTIDAYMGKEKEVVIINTVYSTKLKMKKETKRIITKENEESIKNEIKNENSKIKLNLGMLKDKNRWNTAISRAKKCCILISNFETFKHDPFINETIKYFEENGTNFTADVTPVMFPLVCMQYQNRIHDHYEDISLAKKYNWQKHQYNASHNTNYYHGGNNDQMRQISEYNYYRQQNQNELRLNNNNYQNNFHNQNNNQNNYRPRQITNVMNFNTQNNKFNFNG